MTLLLVCEALETERINPDDNVVISEYAASMGGSQVFLEEGESFTVEELLKCTVIASANDAAVALAELIHGTEGNFVAEMNKRAKELGMKNTNFENVSGLDDSTTAHLTSAEDIAIMSRELIKYDIILKYSSLWQDSIRNGAFQLTNTNRLVRFYDGCNGLKTGSTDKAGFCISATAKRDGMQLIAVIMGAPTRDLRNADARALLDFGFATYGLYQKDEAILESIRVKGGVADSVIIKSAPFACVVNKSDVKKVEEYFEIPESIEAPFDAGGIIGNIKFTIGDTPIGYTQIYTSQPVQRIGFWQLFLKMIKNILN
jgi:D-alanyl-D-alanine carboxypeptidase (penicillin-binding protein 5/6)